MKTHPASETAPPERKPYVRPQVIHAGKLVTRAGSGPLGDPLGAEPLGINPLDSDGFGYNP